MSEHRAKEEEPFQGEESLFTADLFQFKRQMDAAMSRFLEIELNLGQTFADAAIHAHWTHDLLRNRRLARRAYDTATRLIGRANLGEADARKMAGKLQHLRGTLSQLGEPM